ncbi:glutamine amidotransferase-related protein [Endozoicomonas arenosclerae]|uniref:glutamine amidotransferase-related protein n=1 Tax=Endozoicomonas arenosclerae TaxID=1633495 RepID=UPI0007861F7A|nr:hypothetical protein [Endozoicomonas arenosclerae]
MKSLGILNADTLKPEFVAQFGDYPDMFTHRLTTLNVPIRPVTYHVHRDHYPASIDDVDAYLITGSKLSVYSEEAWIKALKNFVIKVHAARKKLIGICFGHQLVAEALGGKTCKAAQGWNVGVQSISLQKTHHFPYLDNNHFRLIFNHQDQVVRLPEGAELIGSTPNCPIAAMLIGDHILTLQGHPEFTPEYARELLIMRRHILGESLFQQATESLHQPTDHAHVIQWLINFILKD